MGKGGDASGPTSTTTATTAAVSEALKDYTAEEVAKHSTYVKNKEIDAWVVYRGDVYDISNFAYRHPGGPTIITNFAGQDATSAMDAFHGYPDKVKKYLKALKVGTCQELAPVHPITKDFNELTIKLKKEGYFESKKWFFALQYLQVLMWECLAYYLVSHHHVHTWGWQGWIGYSILGLILGLANAQAGWLQHDAGHLSIFAGSHTGNFFAQQLTMCFLCGASTTWWKERHNRHHAKTNMHGKDPDLGTLGLVAFGDLAYLEGDFYFPPTLRINKLFFVFFAVPSVTTWLFVAKIFQFIIENRLYWDAFFMALFYTRNTALYFNYVGFWGGAKLYAALRLVQSFIFTWVTMISHVPLPIVEDRPNEDWVTVQLRGTQNVKDSYFNNWFTGHLNYQIEHHLWPQMPRHSYPYVAPYVRELCKKHNIEYIEAPSLWAGAKGIMDKLDRVGARFKKWYKGSKFVEFKKPKSI